MPRRQFVADLAAAIEGTSIAGISDVQPGGDDGEFTFMCVADGHRLNISALIPGRFSPD
jgi:ubiquitin-conjugating enzyme E2 Q